MSIQFTLTLAIELIFILFVALMIFDFIDGLYLVPLPPMISILQPQVVYEPTHSVLAPQFESIPDPWLLELDPLNSTVKTQSFLLTYPSLKLLPPVKKVQQTKRIKNSSKAKSTSIRTKQKTGRPRQKIA